MTARSALHGIRSGASARTLAAAVSTPAPLPLTVVSETAKQVTLGWTPVPGAVGYVFYRDGTRVSNTFDGSKRQVKFSIPDAKPHTFTIEALAGLASGSFVVNGPPSPPSTVSSVGVVRDGSSYDPHEDLSWASTLLCDLNALTAPKDHPALTIFFYRSLYTCHQNYDSCVPWDVANTNGWLLKDSSGSLLVNRGFGGNILDFSNPTALAALLAAAKQWCGQYGFAGIWWDDVNAQYGIQVNALPAGWSAAAWRGNVIAASKLLCAGMTAVGLQPVMNAAAYIGADGRSDTGELTAQFWTDIGPVGAFTQESWLQSPADSTVLMPDDPSLWYGYWPGWRALQDHCRTLGVGFYPFTYGSATGPELIYARATACLSDAPYVLMSGQGGTGAWSKDVGQPTGSAVQTGKVWTRRYENGTATARTASPNPSGSL